MYFILWSFVSGTKPSVACHDFVHVNLCTFVLCCHEMVQTLLNKIFWSVDRSSSNTFFGCKGNFFFNTSMMITLVNFFPRLQHNKPLTFIESRWRRGDGTRQTSDIQVHFWTLHSGTSCAKRQRKESIPLGCVPPAILVQEGWSAQPPPVGRAPPP